MRCHRGSSDSKRAAFPAALGLTVLCLALPAGAQQSSPTSNAQTGAGTGSTQPGAPVTTAPGTIQLPGTTVRVAPGGSFVPRRRYLSYPGAGQRGYHAPHNGNGNRNGARNARPATHSHKYIKADADLASEVDALKERHPGIMEKLGSDLRRWDRTDLPLVEDLPLIAQRSYLLTLEDYGSLEPRDQRRVHDLLEKVAGLPADDRQAFVDHATRSFDAILASPTQLATARKAPHQTCLKLGDEVDEMKTTAAAK